MAIVLDGTTGATVSGYVQASGVATNIYPLVSGTALAYNWNGSTSNTVLDFTSIPSWVKRITVMFQGVSTNGTSKVIVQLGDSGGVETSGYLGSATFADGGTAATNFNSGFITEEGTNAAAVRQGFMTISLINSATFTWAFSGNMGRSDTNVITVSAGTKSLTDTLDRVRVTTVNGTDVFDAGSVNILYE